MGDNYPDDCKHKPCPWNDEEYNCPECDTSMQLDSDGDLECPECGVLVLVKSRGL